MKTIDIETGEEIAPVSPHKTRKGYVKLSQVENNLLIAVGVFWANTAKREFELEDHEIPLRNINIALRNVYLKNKFTYKEFCEIILDWFKYEKEENKLNFFLCMGEQNISKFKIKKKKKDKPSTLSNLADEIIL